MAALRAYWGGRVEAFGRGLLTEEVEEHDIVSLYPYAAISQPLPDAHTTWRPLVAVEDAVKLEGFGSFEFRFPRDWRYPCLPVFADGRLFFPLEGVADCTLSEARLALRLGAWVRPVHGFGFVPSAAERDHDLRRYLLEMLRRKSASPKGTIEYETWRLLLNSLIGKLAQTKAGSVLVAFEHEARRRGFPGLGTAVASSRQLSGFLHERVLPGPLYSPERATLILGKARSVISGIVAASSPYLVSTDAVVVRAGTVIRCPELELLEQLGSRLSVEKQGQALLLFRAREYALLARSSNATRDLQPLAQDAQWAVVKAARHGSVETAQQFAETVLACIRAGRDVAEPRSRIRLLGAEAAIREGRSINAEVERVGKTLFTWDGKRRLLDRDVNAFTSWSETAPYRTVARLLAADRARDAKRTRGPRRSERSRAQLAQVLRLLRRGVGVREAARASGVPKSTVWDLRRRILPGE